MIIAREILDRAVDQGYKTLPDGRRKIMPRICWSEQAFERAVFARYGDDGAIGWLWSPTPAQRALDGFGEPGRPVTTISAPALAAAKRQPPTDGIVTIMTGE